MIPTNVQPSGDVPNAALLHRVMVDAPFLQILSRSQMIGVFGVR